MHEQSEHKKSEHIQIAEKPVTENLLKILRGAKNITYRGTIIGE